MRDIINLRALQLQYMHKIMRLCNDERLYDIWVLVVPDGAGTKDFFDIAEDQEEYDRAFKLFKRLVADPDFQL